MTADRSDVAAAEAAVQSASSADGDSARPAWVRPSICRLLRVLGVVALILASRTRYLAALPSASPETGAASGPGRRSERLRRVSAALLY